MWDKLIRLSLETTQAAIDKYSAKPFTDPWYRCQYYSDAASKARNPEHRDYFIREAFAEADLLGEPNRIVTVSTWPLAVMARDCEEDKVRCETERLLTIISTEPSPVRRADALRHMVQALLPLPTLMLMALRPFVEASLSPLKSGRRNTRGESWLTRALPIIYCHDPAWAQQICDQILGPQNRLRAQGVLANLQSKNVSDLRQQWKYGIRKYGNQ